MNIAWNGDGILYVQGEIQASSIAVNYAMVNIIHLPCNWQYTDKIYSNLMH
jgi:hypothetical protein